MADKKIEQYCKEIADEFVNKYLEELDDNIYKMLNAFGFTGNIDLDQLKKLRNIFDNVVTLWHTDDIGNYSLSNN